MPRVKGSYPDEPVEADGMTWPNAPDSFPVVVESVIGEVKLGAGSRHPFMVALEIVGDHQVKTDFPPATYRFAGVGENDEMVVTFDNHKKAS